MEDTNNLYLFMSLIFYLLLVIAMWKIFDKAGVAGWLSLIPLVHFYFLYKIAMGNGWFCLLMIIPFINVIVTWIMFWKLAKSFGGGVLLRLITMFIPNLGTLILGFGSAEYLGPQ